jgi:hypothetical protein
VFGRLRAYRLQNSTTTNFITMSLLLARRLRDRGFSPQTLAPLFREAGARAMTLPAAGAIANACHPGPTTTETAVAILEKAPPIVFDLKYHPRGLQRTTVRTAYKTTLGPLLTDRHFVVAVSRAPNLRDRLCATTLPDNPGQNPSDILSDIGDN